jgi:hypothetical protein
VLGSSSLKRHFKRRLTLTGRVIGTELFIPDLPRLAELYGGSSYHSIRRVKTGFPASPCGG